MLRLPVHPHIRGVYVEEPPHRQPPLRSIPTYVGFTSRFPTEGITITVHPHIRGVYGKGCGHKRTNDRSIPTYVGFTLSPAVEIPIRSGPSPHTWGLRGDSNNPSYSPRSIPTYVGFTQGLFCWTPPPPVHPHIRGVYTEIKSKISRASSKTALLPAEKFKILFLVKIKSSAAAFQVHTIFRDQFPPGLHFEIALHL